MDSNRQKKIFIFINNNLISKALSYMLTDNFFDVSSYNSQTELLKSISLNKPDLLLFDYRLTGKADDDITNFYVELKSSFVDIPMILMYSTDTRDSVKTLFSRAHPDAMIKKPFKLMELLDKTNKVLYSGKLEDYPFPFLIQTFYDEKRTGVLHITINETKYFVYFIEGQIVYIEYGLRRDTLGMLLLRRDKITEEQYNDALNDASQHHSRLGVSLIKLGHIAPAELNEALEDQVHEKILNCFSATTGIFSFNFQDRFVDDIVIYKKKTAKIIFEGIKRHYDLQRLNLFLNTVKPKKFKIKNDLMHKLDVFGFDTNELKIISKLKSMCIYDELILIPDLDKLLLAQILFTLSVTRYLVVAERNDIVKEKAPIKKMETVKEETLSIVEEAADLKDMIYETYLKIKSLDYYEILGIKRGADLSTIKASYMKLARQFHPDNYSQEREPDIIQKATEIFSKLSNAFKILSDKAAKKEYDFKLDHPKEADILSSANEIILSETEFLKGETLLSQKAFAEAEHAFDTAMQLNPKEPEYKVYYGWAHYLNPANSKREKIAFAKKHIHEALLVTKEIESAYHFLGAIAKFEGNIPLALRHFKTALRMNPDNAEVKMLIKVLEKQGKT